MQQSFFYIKTELILHWGFTVRKYIMSKSRESYLAPPPTTLIGALAYGYAKIRGEPEEKNEMSTAEEIRKNIRSVNIKINTPLIHYADITRIYWYREREKMTEIDAVSIGKTFKGLNFTHDLEVVYVFDKIDDQMMKNYISAALSITRIGGSHGIVSVKKVSYGFAKKIDEHKSATYYSLWTDLLKSEISTPYLRQSVVDYRRNQIGDYSSAIYREMIYFLRLDLMKPEKPNVEIDPSKASFYEIEGGERIVIER